MPEIGETLREARMRRRIDMTEVEAATKIRAKYLRALENEEWDLLPGPTFVKTFLRTYAEYLELDPRMLVEEYRQRYERPSTQDLTPFGPGMGGRAAAGSGQRRSLGPLLVVLGRRRDPARRALPAGRRLGRHARGGGAGRGRVGHRRPPTATPGQDRQAVEEEEEGARPRASRCGSPRRGARLRVPGRRDRQGGRQRRVPRAGQEHQDVPLAALPHEPRQRRRDDARRRQALLRRPTSASRSATRSGRARSPSGSRRPRG